MRSITWWQILLIMAAGAALVLAGCGGGAGPAPAGTGSVQGRIVNLDTGVGVAGITVTITTRSAVSVSPDGSFLVTGLAAGHPQIILALAGAYEIAGGGPIYCDVTADQTTTLPGPIYVLPTGGNPPPPA